MDRWTHHDHRWPAPVTTIKVCDCSSGFFLVISTGDGHSVIIADYYALCSPVIISPRNLAARSRLLTIIRSVREMILHGNLNLNLYLSSAVSFPLFKTKCSNIWAHIRICRRVVLRSEDPFLSRFAAALDLPRKCRLPSHLNTGTSIYPWGISSFECALPPSACHFRSWSSRPEHTGSPGAPVTSAHRQKLGRNRSAGVPRQDVVNTATLTRTEDDYRPDHFSRLWAA